MPQNAGAYSSYHYCFIKKTTCLFKNKSDNAYTFILADNTDFTP